MDGVLQLQLGCDGVPPPSRVSMRGSMNADRDPRDDHASLIAAIAVRQNRAAFASLFSYYAPRVKTYLEQRGCDAPRAEELAQEALLIVWHKAAQYDPARATAAAWIFVIARNLWIDMVRRGRLPLPPPDPSDESAPEPLADAQIVADERARRLRAALRELRPEQVESLRLAFFEERSHSEIERLLGVPLGTVKSRLRLAMSRLREALGDDL
jgi:RNA polymerase sigma-70 factor, ECF subfamily